MAERRAAVLNGERTVDAVGGLLRVGTVAVVSLVGAGTVLVLASGSRPIAQHGPPLDPTRLMPDVLALRPEGLLWLGVLLTVLLPVGRVIVALLGFTRQREFRMTGIALAVLGVLALSVVLATSSGT